MNIRKPAVAGRFYPADPDELREMISMLEKNETSPCVQKGRFVPENKKILGSVVPHAGYIFSGPHAICFFKMIRKLNLSFDTAVIVHPLHASWGGQSVTDDHDAWETPLGTVSLDRKFIEIAGIPASSIVHANEHSAEVMIPFLQYFSPGTFSIVPVGMQDQTPGEAESIAKKLISAEKELSRRTLIIASSDFSHYINPETGRKRDQLVLDRIMAMDPPSVYRVIHEEHVSACGYGPIMTLMYYAEMNCGVPEITILSRGHSGQVHPSPEVVDYITILFQCH